MRFANIVKSYTPGFISALFAAILIAILLGHNPLNFPWWKISGWFLGLFGAGLVITWIVLLGAND